MFDLERERPRSTYYHPSSVEVKPEVLKQLTEKAKLVIDNDYKDWQQQWLVATLPDCQRRSLWQWLLGKPKLSTTEALLKAQQIVNDMAVHRYRNLRAQKIVERFHNLAHNVDFVGNFQIYHHDYSELVEVAAGNIYKE